MKKLIAIVLGVFVACAAFAQTAGTTVGSAQSPANPTASVGLTTVNGSASTFMRSDAAPPISQSITPLWTGLHKYTLGDFGLLGTSTGYTLLESGLTSTANNTLTLPTTSTDTLAAVGTAQTWTALQTFGNNISIGGVTVTGATGTGNNVFATSPTLITPNIGAATASSLTDSGITGSTQCIHANSSGVFSGTGSDCGSGGSTGANPTGTVGLSAVNGSATTFLRSDGAPPLSQSITPTWTGLHKYTLGDLGLLGTSSGYTLLESGLTGTGNNTLTLPSTATDTLAALGTAQTWSALQTFGTNISIGGTTATGSTGTGAIVFASSPSLTTPNIGAATASSITDSGITGSTQCVQANTSGVLSGTGSACGSSSSTGANPTGTVGLTAVNGSATTFMRSDAAPPLSQAITPLWTGLHKYTLGDFSLLGTSTGYTLLESGLSGTSNNTLTLPTTANDTLAAIGTAQTWSALQTFGTNISIGGVTATGATGTGNNVFATSPTLTSPNIGAATATSINGNTFTTGTYTLTGSAGKTLTFSNSLTLAGTDATTMTFPATSGTVDVLNNAQTFTAAKTFTNSDLLLLGSSTGANTFTAANASATNYTTTVPANTGTLAETNLAQTYSALQTFNNSDIALGGSSTGTTTLTSANASASNYTLTLPAVTDTVLTATTVTPKAVALAQVLAQSGMAIGIPPSGYLDATAHLVLGQNPPTGATMYLSSSTAGTGITITFNAATLTGTAAGDTGRVVTINDGTGVYRTFIITGNSGASTTVAQGTLNTTLTTACTSGAPCAITKVWVSGTSTTTNTAGASATYSAPFMVTYANAYLYFPATAAIGTAGFYFCQMTYYTTGQCYNNTYTSGTPTVPGSPTAFSGLTAGAYTQTNGTNITSVSVTVPANSMGVNGRLESQATYSFPYSAGNKQLSIGWGGNTIGLGYITGTNNQAYMQESCTNRAVTGTQMCGGAGYGDIYLSASPTKQYSVDTTANQTFTYILQIGSASTDFDILEYFSVKEFPN